MLTPEELLELVETMQPVLDDLNTWITKDLIRRFMARMEGTDLHMTNTDTWQVQLYQEAGGHVEALQREIANFTELAEDEVRRIFEDAGIRAYAADCLVYAAAGLQVEELADNERMLRILQDTYERTNGEIFNFTRTTAQQSQKRLMKALDNAHMKVVTGAQSYTGAVREAVEELAKGQAEVVYPTGHVDTLETAVLRAVRTGTAQASGNMALQGMIDHNWDIVLVSAHLGARYGDGGPNPGNHHWWQGKFYSRTGTTTHLPDFIEATGYGTGEGLSGWNCRHSFGPGDGVHNPYTAFDAEENRKAYDLSQKQRAMERAIRKTKRELLGYRESIKCCTDPVTKEALQWEYDKTADKLSKQNAAYKDFCKTNDLKPYDDRLHTAKWNREEASRAVGAAKRYKKALEKQEQYDKMIEELRASGSFSQKALLHIPPRKLSEVELEFDDKHINQERMHNVSKADAEKWIRESKLSATVWNGRYERYYAEAGAVYVDMLENKIRTAYSSLEFDDTTKAILEVLRKYGY